MGDFLQITPAGISGVFGIDKICGYARLFRYLIINHNFEKVCLTRAKLTQRGCL